MGIKNLPISASVGSVGKKLIDLIKDQKKGWFLHRAAIYFWSTLLSIIVLMLRFRDTRILIIASPFVFQSLSIALFLLVQDTRFVYPIILTAPIFAALLFSPFCKTERFGKPVSGSPTIVRAFKSADTKHINILRNTPGNKLWQRNYWEHIIRESSPPYVRP